MAINGSDLATWLRHNFRDFCHGRHVARTNQSYHCAHFVSHATQYRGGAEVRTHRLARTCRSTLEAFPEVRWYPEGTVPDRRPQLIFTNRQTALTQPPCLIYISASCRRDIGHSPNADDILRHSIRGGWTHVGFFVGGFVYHYENHACMECVVVQPLEDFMHRYSHWWERAGSDPPDHQYGNRLWRSGLPAGVSGTHPFEPVRDNTHRLPITRACTYPPPDSRSVRPPQVLARSSRVPSTPVPVTLYRCSLYR